MLEDRTGGLASKWTRCCPLVGMSDVTSDTLNNRYCMALRAACIVIAGLLAHPVAAQYEPPGDIPRDAPTDGTGLPLADARRLNVGVSASHDSNFFRDPGLVRSTESETITTGYVAFLIDKPYAQQHFHLSATATAYRYDKNSYLDFNGFDYRAAWNWHLTPRISGILSAARTESPTQFQDTFSRQSDVATTENYVFNLNARVFGGWHVLLGASWSERSSEQESLQGQPDFTETSGEAGIRYLFQSGSSIDALWRRIDGEQDSQVINNVIVVSTEDYQEDRSELRANWILSPASSLTARVTYLDRTYDLVPQNDFSGTEGELGFSWSPTTRLNFRVAATRDIEPWQSLTANYRTSNAYSLTSTWRATDKTSVNLSYRRVYDDYPATSAAVPEREDTSDFAALGLTWAPLRSLSIGASVRYEKRSSNNPLVEYDTTISRITASLIF